MTRPVQTTPAATAARGPGNNRAGRLDWRQVGVLYGREMRAALREKGVVINSILLPIFLYPLILWAAFTGLVFVQGQTEGFVSRIVVRDWPKTHLALRHSLERDEQIQLLDQTATPGEAAERIKNGTLDALLEFLPPSATNQALAGNFQVRITYNKSKERSATARERLEVELDRYRQEWLRREGRTRGLDAAQWQGFTLSSRNMASGRQMGAFLLGLLLPLLFVVTVAMGCFYPAVDATAGERERNTWETLISTAATPVSIVTAKYLYVASLGGLAGILNLAAMAVTMKPLFASLLAKAGETLQFTIPLAALPLMAVAALLLAGFVAAGMMIFASFARTFKEGQAMITPFYMVILLPVMFLQVPGLAFSWPLAFVPIVNVTLVVRAALSGTFPWLQIGITLAVSVGLIALCLRLAATILQFEDVMLGSYSGSLARFFRARVLGRAGPAGHPPEVSP
jgi:sodium transport system permease protein